MKARPFGSCAAGRRERYAEPEGNRERPAGGGSLSPLSPNQAGGRVRRSRKRPIGRFYAGAGLRPGPFFGRQTDRDRAGPSPPSPVSLGERAGAEVRPLIGDKMRTCPEERSRLSEGEKDGIIEPAYLKNRHAVFREGFACRHVSCGAPPVKPAPWPPRNPGGDQTVRQCPPDAWGRNGEE